MGKSVDFQQLLEERREEEAEHHYHDVMDHVSIHNLTEGLNLQKNKLLSAKGKVRRAKCKAHFTEFKKLSNDVKLKAIRDARPLFNQSLQLENEFNDVQVQQIQKVVDKCLNWFMLYNKINIDTKVEDIKAIQ